MSLSDDKEKNDPGWGTIYMRGSAHTLGGLEQGRSTAWTEKDEAAYLERVKEKAGQMAASLIAEARTEAERLRETARREGYEAGLEQAAQEQEAFRADMSETVQAVLGAIEGQCSHIFSQWREDLTAVARLAVSRITGLELVERRSEMLAALLTQAVDLLEKRRELVIRVHPEDEPIISDIVETTKERYADVRSWRVRADPELTAGGLVVESESSLAEGRVESRLAAVDAIMSQLTLPAHPDEVFPEEPAAGHES